MRSNDRVNRSVPHDFSLNFPPKKSSIFPLVYGEFLKNHSVTGSIYLSTISTIEDEDGKPGLIFRLRSGRRGSNNPAIGPTDF
jgi:hypothetical protein